MGTKKYGIDIVSLKDLKEFQQSLKDKKRKRLTTLFQVECLVSINGTEPEKYIVCTNPGILTINHMGTLYIRNRIHSTIGTDVQILFIGKKTFFNTLVIKFESVDSKTHFLTSLGNLFESESSRSDSNSDTGSSDSGL
ncbi:hypothetical protein ABEB36_010750 [Hypothenemus hampei]|uniref:YokE-like PH domain-containing protein n=1 Tax=Hypothenemus hampei TaxID=57062 RepID=A0ABD1EH86_HYPHA